MESFNNFGALGASNKHAAPYRKEVETRDIADDFMPN